MDRFVTAVSNTTSISTDPSTSAAHARWLTPHGRKPDTQSTGLKVLAAGLWRCQTSSLQTAFENLLAPPAFAPSMHGSVILTDTPLLKLAVRAAAEHSDTARRQAMLRQLFAGFNASSDAPGMVFVDDLLDLYPGVKVVLNTRASPADWARSADVLRFWSTWTYALLGALIPLCWWHRRMYWEYDALAKRRFGTDTDIWSERYYELHNAWVKEECRRRGVECLEWEAGMGWDPLCRFLGVEVPNEPFPRSNETKEIQALKPFVVMMGVLTWVVALAVVAGAWYAGKWYLG